MIKAEDFLKLLEEKDLLPAEMVDKLRKQVAQSQKPILATAIAKRLIEKGYLTRPLAKRLLTTSAESKPDADKEPADEKSTDEEYNIVISEPVKEEPIAEEAVMGDVVEDAGIVQDAMADPSFDTAADGGGSLAPRRKRGLVGKLLPERNRRRKANVWDSSLLLLGGGGLAILVILAGIFIWVFWGNTGDAMLEAADSSYKEGAYQTAISKYDEFLKKFPDHQAASPARVRRGLARMRNATEGTGDYAKSLDVTIEVLGKISSEDGFGEARDELRSLLPTVAEGLSKQAHEKNSPEYVAKTREALALVEKYVSKSHRPVTRLDDVKSLLAMTEMRIARDDELAKATAAMQKAIDEGKTPQAYIIRRSLLKRYPGLLDNEELRKSLLAVTAAEQKAVRRVDEEKRAQKPDAADGQAAVSIARRTLNKQVSGVQGDVVVAMADDAVYGLNAGNGTLLWRREVGFGDSSQKLAFTAMRVSKQADSDVLFVDKKSQSLERASAATGDPRWRLPVGEPFDAAPVIDGSRLLVATQSGRLLTADISSGDSPGYISLPQKLSVSPVVDSKRSRIYQVADHSNLYVLSANDGKCETVLYLGHEPGSISASPVIISKYLVLAENVGADSAKLRILALEPKDKKPAPFLLQEITLEGHVDTAPVVSGPRMLVTTDQGRVYALGISRVNAARPLEKVGQLQTSTTKNLVRYPLLVGDQFWVADDHLNKYEIQASLGTLKAKWSTCKDSVFLQPIKTIGNCVFSARRRVGLPGIVVSAIGIDQPDVFWETYLAVGPAVEPFVGAGENNVTIVTSLGGVFEINTNTLESGKQSVLDNPLVAINQIQRPVSGVARMRDGLLIVSTGRGSEQLEVFDPQATPKKFRPLVLPDALAANPIAFGKGIIAPCVAGQVFVLNPRSGGRLLEPFQPKQSATDRPDWQLPVDAGDSVLLSDGRKTLYRLGAVQQPKAHLAALNTVELDARMVTVPSIVGKTAYVVDEKDNLHPLALPKLDPGKPQPLGGRCTWGPYSVGDSLLVANDADKLLCFDADGKLSWSAGLIHGRPVGRPLAVGGDFILASYDGVVWRVAAATGKESAKLETGHSLGAGPVLLGDKLLLCGHDGSLYLIDQPK